LADEVGELADFRERGLGRLEDEAVVEGESLASEDFFADGFQEFGGGEHAVVRCPLSVVSYQLSVISCQLSVVSCQLSVVSCPWRMQRTTDKLTTDYSSITRGVGGGPGRRLGRGRC